MSDNILINVKQATYSYGSHPAARDIDLQMERGKVTGLLGTNGAGKTTTLKLLSANLLPDTGNIEIDGINTRRHPHDIRRHIGYLPEHPPLYLDMTIVEALDYAARLQGIYGAKKQQAVDRVLQLCQLGTERTRLIGHLSKGFQQRVGIAQAIIHDPDIILLDEPSSGLDPIQSLELRRLVRELGQDHAVLFSSHILSDIEASCDDVIIMHEGRIAYRDAVQGKDKDFTIGFGKVPAISELQQLPGVIDVAAIDDHRFRISCRDTDSMLQALIHKAAENAWPLQELTATGSSLEQVFIRQLCQYGETNAGKAP
jgi:ABC-2 type transport system ATP-binding protein